MAAMSSSGAALLRSLRRAEEGELDAEPAAQLLRRLKRRGAPARPAGRPSSSLTSFLARRPPPSAAKEPWQDEAIPPPTTAEEALPPHLQRLKSGLAFAQESLVALPVLRVLSPRSRRKASQLPPPNAAELARLEELCGRAADSPYRSLVRASDRRRAREHRGMGGVAAGRDRVATLEPPSRMTAPTSPAGWVSSDPVLGKPGASDLFDRTRRVQQRSQELEERLREGRSVESAPHIAGAGESLCGPALERVEGVVAGVFDELGVDLDPRFNRMRRLHRGVEVLALFWRRERYRAGIQHLLAQIRRATAALIDRMSRFLQRVGRGFIARVHFRALRRYRLMQRESELLARRAAAGARLRALTSVLLLGIGLRRKVRSLRVKRREQAATVVQRAWRRFALRRSVKGAVSLMSLRARAALIIQCAFRKFIASRKVMSRLSYLINLEFLCNPRSEF